ncbi:MAG TPA: methyltransferase regulatory domain-containing protein [Solirubrobacteraceae bacterium]|nr:methyltransferase regulatory domain-containing protein [Solirubrobacteraceae bacterium]
MLGRLFGLNPARAGACRALEVGCGDGVNVLAIAQTLPGARVVGVDRAASAIDRGRAQRGTAGLDNAELLVGDLSDPGLATQLGEFDYVIAHGVFSWVPPAVRAALLELIKRVLAPHGIAYVSYNAYPGSYLRDMARDILEFHLRGVSGAAQRLARAHELMHAIVSTDNHSPYSRVLREQLQRMLDASDALLYHDELAEISTPFYFHEFIERAASRGLQFLSEADLSDSQLRDVPAATADLIAGLPADVIVREQYLDFFRNRMFRQTLLVHNELVVSRRLDDMATEQVWISSSAQRTDAGFAVDGASVETNDPLVVAALSELIETYPGALEFEQLLTRARERCDPPDTPEQLRARLRELLLELYLVHVVRLDGAAPRLAARAGSQPLASGLARAQCLGGLTVVSTLLPTNHALPDATEQQLVALADGTRSTNELAEALGLSENALSERLDRIAGAGLLLG